MRTFVMDDVFKIEEMLESGKTVEVEWKTPYEKNTNIDVVKEVRWDGLVFTVNHKAIFTGIDKLISITEV